MRLSLSAIPILFLSVGEAHSNSHVSRSSAAIFARDVVNQQRALPSDDDLALPRGAITHHRRLQRRLIAERSLIRRNIQVGQEYEFPDADPIYRRVTVNGIKGKGAAATVFVATSVLHPQIHCAIKYIHARLPLFPQESKFEDEFFKRVHGLPHIVQRLASKRKLGADGTEMTESILLELCDGTLVDEIARYQQHKETWNQRLKEHIIGILEGLVSLHELSPPLAHGNIKPDNILLKNGVIKLGDLGLTTDKMESNIQTGNHQWISPWGLARHGGWPHDMRIKTDAHHTHFDTRKKDVWSAGITMVQMISGGKKPWKRADHDEYTLNFLFDDDHLRDLGASYEVNWLLRDKVFVPKDTDRITARQFLEAVKKITVFTTLAGPSATRGSTSRMPERSESFQMKRSIADSETGTGRLAFSGYKSRKNDHPRIES